PAAGAADRALSAVGPHDAMAGRRRHDALARAALAVAGRGRGRAAGGRVVCRDGAFRHLGAGRLCAAALRRRARGARPYRAGPYRAPGQAVKIAPQPWMRAAPTRALLKALGNAGIETRFVGGCVRDALLGRPIADVDLATPARPEEIIAALQKARIKVVPTGIEHGTVTAVFNSPAPPRHFEITTLRRDVETYGRRARVAFDADWAEDAARRDFTINAIYLDPDGTLHDPVGGVADLEAHRVRFVGEPARRIA